ncbi:condensation domain-containing protein, partial [Plantactinospora solaniradicis]
MSKSALVGVWPLSPLQEGMLFHSQYDDQGTDVYVEQLVMGLGGNLDVGALRASWQGMLDRHESLRACFQRRSSGSPVQLIMRRVALPWREEDLSNLAGDAAEAEAERIAVEEQSQRFNLAVPPLMKLLLIKFGADRYRMVVTLHHILLDGWSLEVLMREFWSAYEAGGSVAGLPMVTPYREYLEWLARQDEQEARDAWRAALAGVDEPTLVAPVFDHGAAQAFSGVVRATTGSEVDAALRELARTNGLTLNTVVQAAWAVVVGQLTGRRDVVFGTSVAGRPADLSGMENMVGLFINTVPVRVRFSPEQTVTQMLEELQAQQTGLVDFQYLSLSEIQRLAGPGGVFDTMMAFENFGSGVTGQKAPDSTEQPPADGQGGGPGGLRITEVGVRESINYPLGLVVSPGGGLKMRLNYRPDLFDERAAQTIVDRMVRVLEQVAADPGLRLSDIEVLDDAERSLVVGRWNDTAVRVPDQTMPELFEAQVAASPDVVAVRCGADVLTYAELDQRANRLARYLTG